MITNILAKRESCSTFLLNKGDSFLIGHNLDERTAGAQPGSIFINKRGEEKVSVSFEEIFTGKYNESPTLIWTSLLGSVTFSSLGKDFIDGGYNEAGLYIQEMSQEEGALPPPDGKIRMFMTLWMQYVLDSFTHVEDVVASLDKISIDGWPWHFFVCDAGDNHTCIDFVDGKPKVYFGEAMPYAVMTNYEHHLELKDLKPYKGFGGEKSINLNDMGDLDPPRNTRFIHACHLIKNASENPDADEAFNILYAMDRGSLRPPGGRHWSYVIDVQVGRIYVETRISPRRRYFDLNAIDFADNKPSQLLDIHINHNGDIGGFFKDVTPESNREALERCTPWWDSLFKQVIAEMEENGEHIQDIYRKGNWQTAVESMANYANKALS